MGRRVNRVVFERRDDIESCLLKPKRESAGTGEQVNSYRTGRRRNPCILLGNAVLHMTRSPRNTRIWTHHTGFVGDQPTHSSSAYHAGHAGHAGHSDSRIDVAS